MEYVNIQFSSALILLLSGIALGVFFDLYRVFRSMIKVNKIVNFIGDLFFWIFALLFLLPLLYWSTWLELRFFVWVSLLSGVLIYFVGFSRSLIGVYQCFWKSITWLPRQLINLTQIVRLVVRKLLIKFHK